MSLLWNYKVSLILIISFLMSASATSHAQGVLLRHHFVPDQIAQTITDVQLKGNSALLDQLAKTDLSMKMFREFRVQEVDSFGNAIMNVLVYRIKTQGSMNGQPVNKDERFTPQSEFDKDLSAEELKQVMSGMTQARLKVSPKGKVVSHESNTMNSLSGMGMAMPANLGSTGGFEFPTLPSQPVRVGSTWDANGTLLTSQSAGNYQWVYKLQRLYQGKHGNMALIQYQKTTDFSNWGLGGIDSLGGLSAEQSSALSGKLSPTSMISGLVIELAGEIEFNIDHGLVFSSTQKGTWSLNMDVGNLQDRPNNKPVNLKQQGMDLQIKTQLRWNKSGRAEESAEQSQAEQPENQPDITLPPGQVEVP